MPSGVSFESVRPEDESGSEFLASTDSWFRPTTVTTGPDGALWITDMYRLVIEHPEWIDDQREKELFLRAGHDRGRIYRVFPSDTTPPAMTKLSGLNSAQLVDQLSSPNGPVRDLAQQLLTERKDPVARQLLDNTVRSSPKALARLHALCTLAADIEIKTLQVALQDPDPTVRRHAVRIAETKLGDEARDAELILAALETCDTSDPHVGLQLAYSLVRQNLPGQPNCWPSWRQETAMTICVLPCSVRWGLITSANFVLRWVMATLPLIIRPPCCKWRHG